MSLAIDRPRKNVKAKIVKVSDLKNQDIERMYEIFSKYYSNHHKQTFLDDLSEKNHVILLKDKSDKSIQGFSTLMKVKVQCGGKPVIGIYSGDTVLEKEYWGTSALGVTFLKYLWFEKIKNPTKPVYWFLISKGYKTYLIMANNFKTHYPRHEQSTPIEYSTLMNEFYQNKFKDNYISDEGIIKASATACRLKEKVAEVTPELFKNRRILFFAEKNPGWTSGDELTCLAKMTMQMPIVYAFKKAFKRKKTK